jgi:hypothetical protein
MVASRTLCALHHRTKVNAAGDESGDQEDVSDNKLKAGAIYQLSMPSVIHYRRLAREYGLKAQRATDPLYSDGYRRLAEGYALLAQGFEVLVKAHRSADDRLSDASQSVAKWINQTNVGPER